MGKLGPEVILLRQYQTMCTRDVLGVLAYVILKILFKMCYLKEHMCTMSVQMPKKDRRRHPIPQKWNDRGLGKIC